MIIQILQIQQQNQWWIQGDAVGAATPPFGFDFFLISSNLLQKGRIFIPSATELDNFRVQRDALNLNMTTHDR